MSTRSVGTLFLPDSPRIGESEVNAGCVLASHPSGRPWIVSTERVPGIRVALDTANGRTAALFGCHYTTDDEVAEALRGGDEALSALHHRADGSTILAVSGNAETWYRPPAFGSIRLHYTLTEHGFVCSDNVFLLIEFAMRPEIDRRALALHLIEPVPHHLTLRPLITGIESVPCMSDLRLYYRSSVTGRWWYPPTATRSISESADNLREALVGAVAARCRYPVVSTDLSGGYDSSAICAIAAKMRSVIGITAPSRDNMSEDVHWAVKLGASSSNIIHRIMDPADLPLTYAELDDRYEAPDLPSIAVTGRARVLAVVGFGGDSANRVHLAGHGGDHVLSGVPTYYHDSLLSAPVESIDRLHAFASLFGWSMRELLRAAAERKSYGKWWREYPVVPGTEIDLRTPMLGWSPPLSIPVWTSERARSHIVDAIRELGRSHEPWGQRGLHTDIESILEGVRTARAIRQMGESMGVSIASPFTDDKVIEACLATKVADRVSARTYKPLLREAMSEIVPDSLLQRNTKDDGSIDVVGGLTEHRDELAKLWENSVLASLGLIDGPRLRSLCETPSATEIQSGAMYSTIGCELWASSADRKIKERGTANGG